MFRTRRLVVLVACAAPLALSACSSSGDDASIATATATATVAPVPATNAPVSPNTGPSDAEPAGTTSSGPTTAGTGAATTTPAPGSQRCTGGQLEVTMRALEGSASAGHQYRSIVFTNVGGAPCTLSGYPGVSFAGAAGTQIGAPADRDPNVPREVVTLAPGSAANAVLAASPGELFGADECGELVTSAVVRVYPPDDTTVITVPTQVRVCTQDVGQFRIRPVQAGGESQP